MSQQINLYEARLRPRRELLSGRNVGLALLLVLGVCLALAIIVRQDAARSVAELSRVQLELKTAQDALTALSASLAERRIAPAVQAELEMARATLLMRKNVLALLDSGRLGNSTGFSGVMAGFSRQAQNDLWLTGFAVGMGGQEIEIRGRLLDPARLPAYVQRLSSEPVFQGRRFATLTMNSVDPLEAKPEAGAVPAAPAATLHVAATAAPKLPRYVEFVLRSEHGADLVAGGEKK